jgi:hypothetical protein
MNNTFINRNLKIAIDKVEESIDIDKDLYHEEFCDDEALVSIGKEFNIKDKDKKNYDYNGKHSHTEGALSGSIYFIMKYKHSL